MLFNNRKKII